MISVTVKTMDSQSRPFEIPEQTTVKDFKSLIASVVEIPADRQRLIYQGRVLSDDFKLTQEHSGKVLHLVQRLPVNTTSVTSSTTRTSTSSSQNNANTAGYNANQLSQMIFQQAMGGLENMLNGVGPSNSAPNTNIPTDQMVNIQIEMNTTRAPVSVTHGTTTSIPNLRNDQHHHRPGYSAPRQQLNNVERILACLNSALDQLERTPEADRDNTPVQENHPADVVYANDFETTGTTDEDIDNRSASEAGDQTSNAPASTSSADSNTNAAGATPTCPNHPSLGELGTYFTRMLDAQHRLEPFLNQTITFLNNDPPFTSTQSPEYRATARMLTLTMQCEQRLSEIQRILSRAVIPLGRTPPRTMLVPAPHGVNRLPPGATRVENLVSSGVRGSPMPSAYGTHRPAMAPRVATTRLGGFQIPNNGGQFRPMHIPGMPPGMQIRFFRNPFQTNTTPSAPNNTSSTASSRNTTTPTSTNSTSAPSTNTTQASNQQTGTGTRINVAPATYSVQINATIEPHVVISVLPNTNVPVSSTTTTTSSSPTSMNQRAPTNIGSQNSSTTGQSNTATITGNVPNIPGVPQDVLSSLFQSVAQTAQQQGRQDQANPSGSIIFVQGPAGGENQIAQDVSSIMGQTVANVMQNILSGAPQAAPTVVATNASSAENNSTTSSSQASSSVSAQATTVSANDSKPETQPSTKANTSTTPSSSAGAATAPSSSAGAATTPSSSAGVATSASTLSPEQKEKNNSTIEDAEAGLQRSDHFTRPREQITREMDAVLSGGSFGARGPNNDSNERRFRMDYTRTNVREVMDILYGSNRTDSRDSNRSQQDRSHTSSAYGGEIIDDERQLQQDIIDQLRRVPRPQPTGPNSVFNRMFKSMLEVITPMELFGITQTNPEPLNRVRDRMQKLVADEYFGGRNPRHVGEIETVVQSELLDLVCIPTREFFKNVKAKKDYDIIESNLSLMKYAMKGALDILFLTDTSTFAVDFNEHIRFVISVMIKLNEYLLAGGRSQLIILIKNSEDFQQQGIKGALALMERQYAQHPDAGPNAAFEAFLDFFMSLSSVSVEQRNKFVCKKSPKLEETESASSSSIRVDTSMIAAERQSASLPSKGHHHRHVSDDKTKSSKKKALDTTTSGFGDRPKGSSEDWKGEVPREWVDVIAGDVEKQKTKTPQLPYSKAYLAGMPASKRRKIVS